MKKFAAFITCCLAANLLFAQQQTAVDSSTKSAPAKAVAKPNVSATPDTGRVKKYNPAIAIRRSAILPGWGQYTNKKYWKIPIVYGALGTTAYFFFYNLHQYHDAQAAYTLATDGDPSNDYLIKQPYYTVRAQPDRIKTFRDGVRQNVDYTVLFFIGFWGLNVADAAVDAHMKMFDVSDKLSLELRPGYSPLANTNGVSLVLNIR